MNRNGRKIVNLIGRRFGRLVVLRFIKCFNKRSFWECLCDCGGTKIVSAIHLGHSTNSCGCLGKEQSKINVKNAHLVNRKHGMTNTRTYMAWCAMLARCFNKKAKQYKDYGGRGIFPSLEWQNSFEAFFTDMGEKPVNLTLERKNNNLGYFKENCYWATRKQQRRNTRVNHYLTYNNETKCIAQWAEELNVPPSRIWKRIKNGWPIEKILTLPKQC